MSKSTSKIEGSGRYGGSFETIEEAFEIGKNNRESYIREVAEKWKPLVDLRVYKAIYDYKINIID